MDTGLVSAPLDAAIKILAHCDLEDPAVEEMRGGWGGSDFSMAIAGAAVATAMSDRLLDVHPIYEMEEHIRRRTEE